MQLKDLLKHQLKTCSPEATVQEVARQMRSSNIGAIPVVENKNLVGIITDRDITLRLTAEGGDPSQTRVGEIMTQNVHACFEDDGMDKAVDLMMQKQIRRCVVVTRHKQPVGMVSIDDLACHAVSIKDSGQLIQKLAKRREPVHAI